MSNPSEARRSSGAGTLKDKRRTGNKAWQNIYGVDRKYTARVDRARERGEYTPKGTKEKARSADDHS